MDSYLVDSREAHWAYCSALPTDAPMVAEKADYSEDHWARCWASHSVDYWAVPTVVPKAELWADWSVDLLIRLKVEMSV